MPPTTSMPHLMWPAISMWRRLRTRLRSAPHTRRLGRAAWNRQRHRVARVLWTPSGKPMGPESEMFWELRSWCSWHWLYCGCFGGVWCDKASAIGSPAAATPPSNSLPRPPRVSANGPLRRWRGRRLRARARARRRGGRRRPGAAGRRRGGPRGRPAIVQPRPAPRPAGPPGFLPRPPQQAGLRDRQGRPPAARSRGRGGVPTLRKRRQLFYSAPGRPQPLQTAAAFHTCWCRS
mmetsp:Transcript_22453/g.63166  ORF Transcript_22453/g.63166 Transcript_22453/m.63166 type:complete len:234 (+) Transcript_22453:256-957(+)